MKNDSYLTFIRIVSLITGFILGILFAIITMYY